MSVHEDTRSDPVEQVDTQSHVEQDPKVYKSPATKPAAVKSSAQSQTATLPSDGAKVVPPKTDKPRPHVCLTCTRSFHRLEHLKRHERSHTKEKPFECQSCNRAFARRDLLLRHQQKLHSGAVPSRRQSTAGRNRRTSTASASKALMRPRANTLSHVDASVHDPTIGTAFARTLGVSHTQTTGAGGLLNAGGVGFRAPHHLHHLRIDTSSLSTDLVNGMRTAPAYTALTMDEFDFSAFEHRAPSSNTINPSELHNHNGPGLDVALVSYADIYADALASQAIVDEENAYEWMTDGFDQHMTFINTENAIESSPSAMDTNSPAHMQQSYAGMLASKLDSVWQQPLNQQLNLMHSPASVDQNQLFHDIPVSIEQTLSPSSYQAYAPNELNWPTPSDMTAQSPGVFPSIMSNTFALPFRHENIPSTASTASIDSSLRQSSVFSNCGDMVSERVRIAVINSLTHAAGLNQRRQSAPVISSPLTSSLGYRQKGFDPATFSTTPDLQRYASAYFRYSHPHLPFLHLPTLNFESLEYRIARNCGNHLKHDMVGGTCLLLSICAMGALYERELSQSRDLFEHAKRMISNYFENRKRHQANRTPFSAHQIGESEDTPLWLVQSMLLNVIYGHNCGDKTSADIASTHCAALVSLARDAELAKPYSNLNSDGMTTISESPDGDWGEWKVAEERKRTLYAVFVLSSMSVMAYNKPPALTNSEIRLDLPCDEELWSADSAQAWRNMGGNQTSHTRSTPFANALTHLLTAAQRERQSSQSGTGWPQASGLLLKPSSFGCLVLIHALHNYIWETRQRHLGRQWTMQEIEAMHAHIEPALRAWQTAWTSNPVHVVERPNPFGAGPLPTDSIPLLDLAYVRLFIDFGQSKEAYWQGNLDGAAKLAASMEDGSDGVTVRRPSIPAHMVAEDGTNSPQASQSEYHLRKAAFYAADHLVNANYFGAGFSDGVTKEMPVQSVLCACDSAQVLAEWITTLQERIGSYAGVIGRDPINIIDAPIATMVDDEDRKLLARVEEFITNAESRFDHLVLPEENKSYGCRVLLLISMIMSQNTVWPVTRMMAQALEVQARLVSGRVAQSTRLCRAID